MLRSRKVTRWLKPRPCFIAMVIVGFLTWVYVSRDLDLITNLWRNMPNFEKTPHCNLKTLTLPENVKSITVIRGSKHFMVSAFIDHRLDGVIRVISIIHRQSLQPLFCTYCSDQQDCHNVPADVQIHSDHFGFPFHVSDVICKKKHLECATRVQISTLKDHSASTSDFLPIRNNVKRETFRFDFTVCISSLFGNYSNVLQFAQTMEMYKLLGVQRVVIYKTDCTPELEKLLTHYEREGFLEIVSWPIDQFLNPSTGWIFKEHKGDLHYYGQLVTLNECVYRNMYQSRYVLLNDIDEITVPNKHRDLPSLMEELQSAHPSDGVFKIENHLFPTSQYEETGKFKREEWSKVPGVNIMEHIYRKPVPKNVLNPTKLIINPRMVEQTSVHVSLMHFGNSVSVPNHLCRTIHVRAAQGHLKKQELIVDKKIWDFEQNLVPNTDKVLKLSGLLE